MNDHERRSEVGERLRGVFRYGGSDRVEDSVGALGLELPSGGLEFFFSVCETRFDATPYGPHRASIHVLADATVVHVPDESGGLVATLEPNAIRTPIDALVRRVREAGR